MFSTCLKCCSKSANRPGKVECTAANCFNKVDPKDPKGRYCRTHKNNEPTNSPPISDLYTITPSLYYKK